MRTIFFIIQKEFLQLKRDKKILIMSFAIPIIQLLILVNAATFELDNIDLAVVDKDYSTTSQKVISKFSNNDYFHVSQYLDRSRAEESIQKSKSDAVLIIPHQIEKKIMNREEVALQLEINAINQNQAGIAQIYINSVIKDYLVNKIHRSITRKTQSRKSLVTRVSYWFNQELKYSNFMVPGILSILITIIGMFLTSMGIVRGLEVDIPPQEDVSGRADAIISVDNELYVVDFKTISHFSFSKLNEPKSDNKKQLQLYMHYFDINKGVLLYEDKNNQAIKEFILEYDKELVQEILDKFDRLKDYIEKLFYLCLFQINTFYFHFHL